VCIVRLEDLFFGNIVRTMLDFEERRIVLLQDLSVIVKVLLGQFIQCRTFRYRRTWSWGWSKKENQGYIKETNTELFSLV